MSESNLPMTVIFCENYRQMRELCSLPRPDRASIGSKLMELINIVDDFPYCEQPRYLTGLHRDVVCGGILDETWGPTVEFAIVTRILLLGDPPIGKPLRVLVEPQLLAYMHQRYASIVVQYPQLGFQQDSRAHQQRAFELAHPRQHHTQQIAKKATKQVAFYLLNRQRRKKS